tara:strand:+ start:2016 stop:2213 length:198 start_codon:yes stop_codon:yes gene_type:complete
MIANNVPDIEITIRIGRTPGIAKIPPDQICIYLQIDDPAMSWLGTIRIPRKLAAGIGRALMEFKA